MVSRLEPPQRLSQRIGWTGLDLDLTISLWLFVNDKPDRIYPDVEQSSYLVATNLPYPIQFTIGVGDTNIENIVMEGDCSSCPSRRIFLPFRFTATGTCPQTCALEPFVELFHYVLCDLPFMQTSKDPIAHIHLLRPDFSCNTTITSRPFYNHLILKFLARLGPTQILDVHIFDITTGRWSMAKHTLKEPGGWRGARCKPR